MDFDWDPKKAAENLRSTGYPSRKHPQSSAIPSPSLSPIQTTRSVSVAT